MVTEPSASKWVRVAALVWIAAACRAAGPWPPVIAPPEAPIESTAPRGGATSEARPDPGPNPNPSADDRQEPLTPQPRPSLQALRREAHRVVDDWHAAAAVGDAERYLAHMAPDSVFLGTDATERWDLTAFRAYVERFMTPGKGWVYVPSDRTVVVPEDSDLAWFDERLASAGYGELRGTGVLRRDAETWRIVHYSMTFTVPNEVARDVVTLIRGE